MSGEITSDGEPTRNRPTRGTGGRPSVLTPKVRAAIVEALRRGNYLETAAAIAGVSRSTAFAWVREGESEAGRPELKSFSEDVRRAQGEAEARLVEVVDAAAMADDWRAAAWRLERSAPSRWCVRVRETVRDEMGALLDELAETLDAGAYRQVVDAAGRLGGESLDFEPPPSQKPGLDLSRMGLEDMRALRDIMRRNAATAPVSVACLERSLQASTDHSGDLLKQTNGGL
jgi:hypothetical protein